MSGLECPTCKCRYTGEMALVLVRLEHAVESYSRNFATQRPPKKN